MPTPDERKTKCLGMLAGAENEKTSLTIVDPIRRGYCHNEECPLHSTTNYCPNFSARAEAFGVAHVERRTKFLEVIDDRQACVEWW